MFSICFVSPIIVLIPLTLYSFALPKIRLQLLSICTSLKVSTTGLNLDLSIKVFQFSTGASPFVLNQA